MLVRLALISMPLLFGPSIALSAPAGAMSDSSDVEFVNGWLDEHLSTVVDFYKELHADPELSLEERETSTRVAIGLAESGYIVQTGIGGHGVVGVLENGPGPVLLIRGDMDALPITEKTGLPYASRVVKKQPDGTSIGVMHACGHDIHTANLLGSGKLLADARSRWSGSLVLLAQPAEELGRGSLAMMRDGLFEKIPRPTFTLALHVESSMPAGEVGTTSGWAGANVDAVKVTIHGRGGHGARPHTTVDPITIAAYFVTQLQTLVSRRVDPLEPAVVSVGSIHGGEKSNVIPDRVELEITVRSYTDPVRELLLDGIRELATDLCLGFRCPKPPTVEIREAFTPAVYNDPDLTARAVAVFQRVLGADRVVTRKPSMGGDDFGRFARELEVPGLLFRLGSVNPKRYRASLAKDGPPLPSLHSSLYAPDPVPTLRTAVRATTHLAFEILGRN